MYCITIGLIRQSFIGPNGFEIEGGYRRGIGLAPFECEAYRAVAALNKIADMKKPNNFTFPLYANGGFVFTTKTLSGDGEFFCFAMVRALMTAQAKGLLCQAGRRRDLSRREGLSWIRTQIDLQDP